ERRLAAPALPPGAACPAAGIGVREALGDEDAADVPAVSTEGGAEAPEIAGAGAFRARPAGAGHRLEGNAAARDQFLQTPGRRAPEGIFLGALGLAARFRRIEADQAIGLTAD